MSLSLSKDLREIFFREFRLMWQLTKNVEQSFSAAKDAVETKGGIRLPKVSFKIAEESGYIKAKIVIGGLDSFTESFPIEESDDFSENVLAELFCWDLIEEEEGL